jgi:Nickel responsive protein SCO4226-like
MAEFLVELYVSREDGAGVERGAESARLAAEELTREGTPVRYLRSIFVPEDETCFFLYEAASADAVREAAQRAGVVFERIAETVAQPGREEALPCP